MNDPRILPVFTIEEDGSISQGAQVDEFTSRRGDVRPVISVGEQTKGGWKAFVFVDLTPESDNFWDLHESVTIEAVKVEELILTDGTKASDKPGLGNEWKYKLVEVVSPEPGTVTTDAAIVVIRRRLNFDASHLPGKRLARGRIAGNPPEGEDNGKQVIQIMLAREVILLSLRDGGREAYIIENGELRSLGSMG